MNVPEPERRTGWRELVDETTMMDHNVYHMGVDIVNEGYIERNERLFIPRVYDDAIVPSIQSSSLAADQVRLTIVKEPSLVMRRFFPFNVMHILHDDWLGYCEVWDLWGLDRAKNPRVVVYDHNHANPHDHIYNWLGPKMQRIEDLMGWPNWVSNSTTRRSELLCFNEAYIGNSKENTWYQYGYFTPQGPLANFNATGWRLREIGKRVFATLKVDPWCIPTQVGMLESLLSGDMAAVGTLANSTDSVIAIFSRKLNRIIINEAELAKGLEDAFGIPVVFLRMEEMSLNTIARILRRAVMAFGMHGSLMAMAMLLPPGAIVMEGYPYGVPAENYTPYKTMANLPGMHLTYRPWTCTNPKDSVSYPDRKQHQGGIRHLPEEEQTAIIESTTIEPHLCCSDPYWLFRIYQDTRVEVQEVVDLFTRAIPSALDSLPKAWRGSVQ